LDLFANIIKKNPTMEPMEPQEFSAYVDDLLRKIDHPFLERYQYCLGKNLALLIDSYNSMQILGLWRQIHTLKNEAGLLPFGTTIQDKLQKAVQQWELDIETPEPDDGMGHESDDEEDDDGVVEEDGIREMPTDKPVTEKWKQKQKAKQAAAAAAKNKK